MRREKKAKENKQKVNKLKLKRGVSLLFVVFIYIIGVAGVSAFMRGEQAVPTYVRQTKLEGIAIESVLKDGGVRIAVHYPKTENEEVNGEIKKFVLREINAFEEACRQRGISGEFTLHFEVFRYAVDIVSFHFQSTTNFENEPKGKISTQTKTYDVTAGKELSLRDIFEKDNYLEKLSQLSYDTLSGLDIYKYSPEQTQKLRKGTRPAEDNFNKFVLDKTKLILFFGKNQIGLQNNKVHFAEIPIAQVQDDFKEEFRVERVLPEPAPEPKEEKELAKTEQYTDEELKGKKLIALTFDDGPHAELTPKLLSILEKQDVRATFYLLGSRVEYYPEIVKDIDNRGHQIGSHTQNHKNLTNLKEKDLKKEIERTDKVIEEVVGYKPTTVRPPYGASDEKVRKTIGRPVVMWGVDSLDWKSKDSKKIRECIVRDTKDGDIILLHDIHQTTVDSVEKTIKELKKKEFTFVTVDQLIRVRGKAKPGEKYFSLPPQ